MKDAEVYMILVTLVILTLILIAALKFNDFLIFSGIASNVIT
jgi:hypothetical protein